MRELLTRAISTSPVGGKRRVMVIINPAASSVSARVRALMVSALRSRYEVDAEVTDGPGHASELARSAGARELDAVIAFGGDGTANEVANGLGDSKVPLTCLPGGSANVFCGVTGIPRDLAGAVRQLLQRADEWNTRTVDSGSVNGRTFLFNSGVGLDARVLAGVDSRPDLKRRWRQWWFVTHAAQVFASDYAISAPRLRVVGEPETEGIVAVVQNGRPWTYFGQRPITVSRDAGLQTGSLAATVVDRPLPWDFLPMGWRVFSGRGAEGHSRVKTVHSDGFTIEPIDEPTIDLHVDGDPLGAVERAEYGLRRDALTILA